MNKKKPNKMATKKRENIFSKDDSLCMKGIAIILLVWLHCFCRANRFAGYEVITLLDKDWFISISEYFRICVSIFAFISGYGLYLSSRKQCINGETSTSWIITRLIKTLSGFWIVYIISFVITQLAVSLPQKTYFDDGIIRGVAYSLIDFAGLAGIFNTPRLNGSWWYMSASIIFIVIMPFISKLANKIGLISICGLLLLLPRAITDSEFLGAANPYSILSAVLLGAIFCEYNLFDKFNNIKITGKKILDDIIIFVLLAIINAANILIWIRVPYSKIWEYHFAIIPIFVILFCLKFVVIIPIIRPVLKFLGVHSMNIFLFHTFLRADLIPDFIYSFKYPVVICTVLIALSLVFSFAVEFLKKLIKYDSLMNKLTKKTITLFEQK